VKHAAVILAAGSGKRLGGAAKALLRIDRTPTASEVTSSDRTFLEAIVATAREVGCDEVVVVVGPPYGIEVAEHARALGARVVTNPDPARGMASSVALGFGALSDARGSAASSELLGSGALAASSGPLGSGVLAASSDPLGFGALAASSEAQRSAGLEAAWLWPVDHPRVTAATLRAMIAALGGHAVARPRFGDRGGHPPLIARALWPALAACGESGARAVFASADVVEVVVDDAGVVRDVDTPADVRALG
jgi:CTP:molybdopterin cytidylyltransferase MocA